jgi:hypothetical protein
MLSSINFKRLDMLLLAKLSADTRKSEDATFKAEALTK